MFRLHPAAGKVSGSGFYILKGDGARLERALVNYMLDMHAADGFTEVSVPHLVNADSMFGTGQLPKLAEDMYKTSEDGMYLIPQPRFRLPIYISRKLLRGAVCLSTMSPTLPVIVAKLERPEKIRVE